VPHTQAPPEHVPPTAAAHADLLHFLAGSDASCLELTDRQMIAAARGYADCLQLAVAANDARLEGVVDVAAAKNTEALQLSCGVLRAISGPARERESQILRAWRESRESREATA
jgi:hypothetical protein